MQSGDSLIIVLEEWLGILRQQMEGSFSFFARENGLTMPQFGTMMRLYHKGACGVSHISSDLGVTNSAASQMLERLVQLNLISRTEDPSDRRVRQIILTEKGRQIVQASNRLYHAW